MAVSRPVLLLACGSFNPPTVMHLRLFELAKDHLKGKGINVLGGIISPVNDAYPKKELAPSSHRVKMVDLALENYDFVKCSKWEVEQGEWTRTRAVLDHYNGQVIGAIKNELESKPEWLPSSLPKSEETAPRLLLLCGGDLLETFSVPGLWKDDDIIAIARDYGLVVISREGSNPEKYVYDHDVLHKYKENIHLVTERVPNDISSTRIRKAVKRGESIKFFVPDPVIGYIESNQLYQTDNATNEYKDDPEVDACVVDVIENTPIVNEPKATSDVETPHVIPIVDSSLVIDTPSPPAQELCMNEIAASLDVQDVTTSCMTSSPPTIETFHVVDSNEIEPIDHVDEVPLPPPPVEEVAPVKEAPAEETVSVPTVTVPVEAPAPASVIPDEDEDCSCASTGSRSPTPVHFEITPKGVKVISDKESFL